MTEQEIAAYFNITTRQLRTTCGSRAERLAAIAQEAASAPLSATVAPTAGQRRLSAEGAFLRPDAPAPEPVGYVVPIHEAPDGSALVVPTEFLTDAVGGAATPRGDRVDQVGHPIQPLVYSGPGSPPGSHRDGVPNRLRYLRDWGVVLVDETGEPVQIYTVPGQGRIRGVAFVRRTNPFQSFAAVDTVQLLDEHPRDLDDTRNTFDRLELHGRRLGLISREHRAPGESQVTVNRHGNG